LRPAEPPRAHGGLALAGPGGDHHQLARGAPPPRARLPVRERLGRGPLLAEPGLLLVGDAGHRGADPLGAALGLHEPREPGRALAEGPASLTGRERRILLGDPDLTDALHRRVWALPDHDRAARWGRPGLAPHPGSPTPSP